MADILLGNVKGPQGNTGATGSQGPQGDAATITVGTVSTTAYGNTAQVINSGTEQDAVLDFVIPQGKPGEQTTRMGALTLDTITAQSADFPIPAVGETGSTVFGKIIKFFNSTISALNSKLNISDVVNNLTSTSTTQPLSAAQGKALNDAYASLTQSLGTWSSANIDMKIFSQTANPAVARASKISGVKMAHIEISCVYSVDIPTGTNFAMIPAAFRPKETLFVPMTFKNSNGDVGVNAVRIDTAGYISQYVTASLRIMFVDTWIPIS